jgi:osmotically-inducible protein OsmY
LSYDLQYDAGQQIGEKENNPMIVNPQTDEDIRANVQEELKWDMRVRSTEIGVVIRDGIVTLTGWVDSYIQKVAAQEAAHRVQNVKAVANDIEVHLPGFAERTDTDLATAVLNALKWDASIPTSKLDVTVSNGFVTLKGEVEYGFQKRDAENAIRHLSGIRGVINQILVKPHLWPSNLKQNIEKAFVRTAETDARRLVVEAQGSKVILRGTVRSYAEKRAAEESVWAASGVSDVDNRIAVSLES